MLEDHHNDSIRLPVVISLPTTESNSLPFSGKQNFQALRELEIELTAVYKRFPATIKA